MLVKAPIHPELDRVELTPQRLDDIAIRAEATYEAMLFTGMGSGEATHSRWAACRLDRARLSGVVWTSAHWEDLHLTECDLANATATRLYGVRILMEGCRLLGMRANESTWRDVTVKECTASLAQFSGVRFERTRFESCDFTEADFTGADLRGVVFRDCDLRKADFTGAKLLDADWRGSQVEGLRIDVRSLRGLIVSAPQAAHFAKLMGLRVRAEEAN